MSLFEGFSISINIIYRVALEYNMFIVLVASLLVLFSSTFVKNQEIKQIVKKAALGGLLLVLGFLGFKLLEVALFVYEMSKFF